MGPKDSKITHFVGLSANIDLVGGFNQLEKYGSMGRIIPYSYHGTKKNVWNRQPVIILLPMFDSYPCLNLSESRMRHSISRNFPNWNCHQWIEMDDTHSNKPNCHIIKLVISYIPFYVPAKYSWFMLISPLKRHYIIKQVIVAISI